MIGYFRVVLGSPTSKTPPQVAQSKEHQKRFSHAIERRFIDDPGVRRSI